MSQSLHGHQKLAGPYWRRAHRDWRFYVAAVLMVGALLVYILGYNFAYWDRTKLRIQVPRIAGR